MAALAGVLSAGLSRPTRAMAPATLASEEARGLEEMLDAEVVLDPRQRPAVDTE
jgi:hypothetical protein